MDQSGKYMVDPPTYEEAMANPPEEVTEEEVKKEKKKVVTRQPTNWTSNSVISAQPPAVQTYTAVDGGAGTTHVDDTCTLWCCFWCGNPVPKCDCCCDCDGEECQDCKCGCCSCDDCCGDCDCGDCDCGNCDCGNCDCDLGGCVF